jgi:hypothetical protein
MYRVLGMGANALQQAWDKGLADVLSLLDKEDVKYGIEASRRSSVLGTGVTELDWDVLVLSATKLEFAEAKSGTIAKDDRIALWSLRRELVKPSNAALSVIPVLVVDPTKAGDLDKWQKLAQTAATFMGSPPSVEPTNNVLNATHLLNEALWCLCSPDTSRDKSDAPASITNALTALGRFQLHCHEAQELDSKVLQLLELLFPGGLADTQHNLLLGWLGRRATNPDPNRRLFTTRELLADIGILADALSLRVGTLKEWHDLWNELPQGVIARSRLRLGNTGESISAMIVQPAALAAAMGADARSLVILGPGGIGKSTFLTETADTAIKAGHVVLHCGAHDLNEEELEKIIKAFRFRAVLAAIKSPTGRACILVDGLDETEVRLRKRWAQLLSRLTNLPNANVFVSVRDAIWNTDGDLRKALEPWPTVSLQLWPETLVRDLLKPTPYHGVLPQSVIDLLRTPILLDLFWRTFVESNTLDVSLAARMQTRHNLLAVYWEKRLIHSSRYASVHALASRVLEVCSQAVHHIGPFPESQLDAQLVEVLLSEGILVREGRLQPRLKFRHPLLRDFAFAQWCLAPENPSLVAERWNSIHGGLQRYGALRTIFESVSDWNARTEYPQLELGCVVQEIACKAPALAGQVAQVLGTHLASPPLNPSTWPPAVQAALPAQFGSELLAAARMARNGSWTESLEAWPDTAGWLNKEYPQEVWRYASTLVETFKTDARNVELREQCGRAARKLRKISESEAFASEFAKGDRGLKMQSMLLIIPVLPDQATVAWVEREMDQWSWRTRSQVLELLTHLASVDADRAAAIYRSAVGLSEVNGQHILSGLPRGAVMDHQMIEWSLAGEGGRRSLLKEHPENFLPVAVDLVEALWHGQQEERSSTGARISEYIRELDPSWSEETEAEVKRQEEAKLGGLIDDSAEYGYWHSLPNHDPRERCLRAIHECAAQFAQADPNKFISSLYPVLRSSRLASVQSILLDVLLHNKETPGSSKLIAETILDPRLYYASGIEYWLEQGVIACWPSLQEDQQNQLFDILRRLLRTEEEHNAKNLLLTIPLNDLPGDLQPHRPADNDPDHVLHARPVRSDFNFEGVEIKDDDERMIGPWPDDFDRELLMQFVQAMKQTPREPSPGDNIAENLSQTVQPVLSFLRLIEARKDLLQVGGRLWVWRELARFLETFRRVKDGKTAPPQEIVTLSANLALFTLKNSAPEVAGDLPEEGIIHYSETGWSGALALADAALTWEPAASDEAIQAAFSQILETAFAAGNPMAQFVCANNVRAWHWFRDSERRQLHERLWRLPKHANVLAALLSGTRHYSDADRSKVFRTLLNRDDVQEPKKLAHWLGQHIGIDSMIVFPDGKRSAAAELARDVMENSEAFGLLRDNVNRREFLRQFAFGMKEQANAMWSRTELASDYGSWARQIWRVLRLHKQRRNESEGVVLITMHWLEKKERQNRDRAKVKIWWDSLQPLFNAVVAEGGRGDCFTLFYNLHGGEYSDLATPEELIQMGELLAEKIRQAGSLSLDDTDPAQQEWHSWREITELIAETVNSIRRDGLLQNDAQRDRAHRLLLVLAAAPIRSLRAVEVLHRLQEE